ncbi:hypothetical protein ARALYDRAFT_919007 [Arabidopsis lyrata subsp. lyrata]|uniref:Longin domain-containing protein n=1 Tax=Arabidopsis lyrata subsp. lyrata TaxID=81972 RepID=D7MPL5_ARALL|nr:hypothetical protein ARALYDRAFT_919007 [Arabidopsis lyrata subsp. lyrata]
MKITALLVLKCDPKTPKPVILANVSNLLQFEICTFYRSNLEEFIVFIARTVAKRTPPGQCNSVKHEEYKVHAYNINGLCAVGFMDDHYPVRSAFSLLDQYETTDDVLGRGEELDSLVERSTKLSLASKMFYKQAKKTNSCCTIL